jgi:hypothetical protein
MEQQIIGDGDGNDDDDDEMNLNLLKSRARHLFILSENGKPVFTR